MVLDEVPTPREGYYLQIPEGALSSVVRQSDNSAIQAIYSVAPRSYASDRLCLVGDAGAVFPPFTGSGVLKAVANATSLAPAPTPRPLMMLCVGGVRPSSRSLPRSGRSLNTPSGARCSRCQTTPRCQPQRPTTGCPPPVPGLSSRSRRVTGRRQTQSPSPLHSGRPGADAERSISRYTSDGHAAAGMSSGTSVLLHPWPRALPCRAGGRGSPDHGGVNDGLDPHRASDFLT
jgi:hypothetical protein